MFDERHYSAMEGESEDVENRMNTANEISIPSTPEAGEFIDEYVKSVLEGIKNGDLDRGDVAVLRKELGDI